MKLENVLKEDNTANGFRFRDLNSFQVSALMRMASGRLSYDTASPREMAIIDSLKDLGLVNDFDELTHKGELAARIGKQYGSLERREAATRDQELGRVSSKPQRYTDVDDGTDVETDSGRFTDKWGDVKDFD